nr:hypothetical protein [Tanacetum cinerariifolium]
MARLAFCDYHNMIAVLEKYATSSPSLPPVTTATILTVIPTNTPQLRGQRWRRYCTIWRRCPNQRRSLDEGEEAAVERSTERGSDDTEEMVTVLTSLDAASILTSGISVSISPVTEVSVAEVPTGSGSIPTASPSGTGVPTGGGSIPTASPPGTGVPTGSGVVPTASLIFTTATVATPYTRRKGKEKMVESDTPKKKKLQKQMNVQMARQEDLNQLWALVKETLNIRQAANDKEKELWVELKRLFEPDVEDQLWTYTQALIHELVEWSLYDSCGVHHVLSKDQTGGEGLPVEKWTCHCDD